MATSADREDHDEDEKDEAEESPAASAKKKDAKAGSAQDRPAKASAKAEEADEEEEDEEEEDDEEEDGEEDEDEEGEDEEAAKPAARPASKAKAAVKGDDEAGAKSPPKRVARGPGARGPGANRPKPAPAQGGSLGKSVLLFVVIVVGLGAGFAILGREPPAEQARPKWKTGDTVDIEVTLVPSDRQDLACASDQEITGKHCAFEAMNKPWSKGGGEPSDDKQILKPYTTAPPEHIQFTAAGLWSEPALSKEKLPATRFSVKCKYKVEGTLKSVAVRWEQTGQWYPQNEWYTGTLTDCKLTP
jgi:hypothetical protein